MVHVSGEVANSTTNPDGLGTVARSAGGSVARLPVADDSAGTALDLAADFLLVALCVCCRGQTECKDRVLDKSSGYTNPASK